MIYLVKGENDLTGSFCTKNLEGKKQNKEPKSIS